MTIKTITLARTETRAAYSGGANAWLRNDSTGTVYASAAPGVTAGADGVVSIPAGGKAVIYGACGAVYLLGTGSVLLVGSDYTASPFDSSAASGGSGETAETVFSAARRSLGTSSARDWLTAHTRRITTMAAITFEAAE